MLARLTATGLLLSGFLLASNADGRVEARSGYTKTQTFNGAPSRVASAPPGAQS